MKKIECPGRRVMLVEDEFLISMAMRRQVELQGCEVCCVVSSAQEALGCAMLGEVRLAFVDVSIDGDMDGIDLAERLVREHGIAVVIVSAYNDRPTVERALRAGALAVLGKPVDDAELAGWVEKVLGPRP